MGHCSCAYVNDRERKYHATEWGVPVHDDQHIFEHLTLENLQCIVIKWLTNMGLFASQLLLCKEKLAFHRN